MKKKIISVFVVLFLFGLMAVFMHSIENKNHSQNASAQGAAVKICPHSGLPCDGDGDCETGEQGECSDSSHKSSCR